MGFVDALKQALEEKRGTEFPEVERIVEYSDRGIEESCYLLIDIEKEEPIETGESTWQAVNRKANIMVIKRIGKELVKDITGEIETTGGKVAGVLKANPKLISVSYPEGFLIEGSILESDSGQSVNPAGSEVAFFVIVFQGSFFRRDQ